MTARRPRPSEAGATLIEILVTVMILGVAFVAFLGGMGTSIMSSDLHRRQAEGETLIRRYAEFVKAQPYAAACPASYSSAGFSPVPSGFTVAPPTVAYRDTAGGSACSVTASHIVTVGVDSTDGRVTERLEVVKRP